MSPTSLSPVALNPKKLTPFCSNIISNIAKEPFAKEFIFFMVDKIPFIGNLLVALHVSLVSAADRQPALQWVSDQID